MTRVSANNNWIPFIHLLATNKVDNSSDYSNIFVKIPFVSEALGYYMRIDYQFSDSTLSYL